MQLFFLSFCKFLPDHTHGILVSNQGLNSGFPAVEAESYPLDPGKSLSRAALRTTLRNVNGKNGDISQWSLRVEPGFMPPTEFLYPHPISWMIFLTELSIINELSLLQTWLCSGQVKGTLKDMVWTVESRISHEVNQVQLLLQESLPEEISSKCLELGAWGLGDLVLRHGKDLPQRWSWRFIFSCKI